VVLAADSSEEPGDVDTFFHRLNNVLPEQQEIVSVGPDATVAEALAIMSREGYSQLPIVEGREVLGAFTFRSFSLTARSMGRADLSQMPVLEFAERVLFARPQDNFEELIDALDRDGAVFVGDPDRLIGIATTVDVLRYLFRIANVYVLLQEIELALRELLRHASGSNEMSPWMLECLSAVRDADAPTCFEDLSFGDYALILQSKTHWQHLEDAFGRLRSAALARVRRANELRNVAFHFRRAISTEDHENLADTRDWLLNRLRIVNARRRRDDLP